MSDWEYRDKIDPACAKKVVPLLGRFRKAEVAVLDIFGGGGNFLDMVLKGASTQTQHRVVPMLIERDARNVANARELLRDRGAAVIEAEMGPNSAGVWGQLPRRPDIVTSIGGINEKVIPREGAIAVAKQVYDNLPPGGIFVISGLSMCHLNRDDFEAIGFRVEDMAISENIFTAYPFQFYVLVKPDLHPPTPNEDAGKEAAAAVLRPCPKAYRY